MILTISQKTLSARDKILVNDSNNSLIYSIERQFTFIDTRKIRDRDKKELAIVKSIFLSWWKSWKITGSIGDFIIKKKFWSLSRKYIIVGGKYDGAIISGDFWDIDFKITQNSNELASASSRVFTMRDRHDVHVYSNEDALLTAIAMGIVLSERKVEKEAEDDWDD